MSFIMLSESQIGPPPAEEAKSRNDRAEKPSQEASLKSSKDGAGVLSQRMEKNLRLFEILSARSDIDHPICSECTDLLLNRLQQRQTTVGRERDAYVDFLRKAQDNVPSEQEQQRTREALAAAKQREATALRELEELEATKAALEDEIAALDREAVELEADEEAFWTERNAYDTQLAKYCDERDSLQNEYDHDSKLLESLQRTNVYNDCFCIGHDGPFGTINGLRLGRTPEIPVEWPEINAAWGQAVLLLVIIAEKLQYTFQGYRLIPVGSTSKIEKLDYPQGTNQSSSSSLSKPKVTSYDLSCNGDLPLGLGFLHRGFDNAMVCFLDCLRQLGEHVKKETKGSLKLPYEISKDKIGDSSIKLGAFNQEEVWTKACKYTMTCCKYLLAHASHVDESEQEARAGR